MSSANMRIVMAQTCQPDAASPPSMRVLRRFFVQMMRLRIELAREFDDLFLGHG